ncbi:His Kinase A (phospho-acceptor) domain-containing protein [Sphingomonas laterariae]|uniref:histidine kinase n=2 Tax=Edaphosphingomonas laterariae TaxID=861865 RepID=A0A239I683_9SPHN|nr:His Kinase A (phospho-acceptor) domain-containing protein [Sphingomonas laterariae]
MTSRKPASWTGHDPFCFGSTRWLKVDIQPWEAGIVVTASEVTPQKRAEADLAATNERLGMMGAAAQDMIYDWDVSSGDILWGSTATSFFGIRPDPGTGLIVTTIADWDAITHPADHPRIWSSIQQAFHSGAELWFGEYRMRKGDGTWATLLDRASIVRDDAGRAVRLVGAIIDLTQARQSERELQRLHAQIGAIERDSAMGTMGATMAHELAQPLTAVESYLGAAELIAASVEPDHARLASCLARARESVDRTRQIIYRMKSLVTRGETQRTPIQLREAIGSVIDEVLAPYDDDDIAVHLEIDRDLMFVGDPVQLLQVLSNLVRNSAEAMRDCSDRQIRMVAKRDDDRACVECRIEDTGRGIAPELQHLIFSPFFTTKDRGAGVGLSVCRTIIEAHLGRIWYEAGPEGGSIFHIVLPLSSAPPLAAIA